MDERDADRAEAVRQIVDILAAAYLRLRFWNCYRQHLTGQRRRRPDVGAPRLWTSRARMVAEEEARRRTESEAWRRLVISASCARERPPLAPGLSPEKSLLTNLL